jgi:carbamoyl-phosphate synthase large subunit
LVVNTPHGSPGAGGSARVDGYEIRTAAVRANVPCITTVQGLGAAVQGIEARNRGDIGVRSLQGWANRVRPSQVRPSQVRPSQDRASQDRAER